MENIQNSQSGKMSEELLAQAKVKTSDVCWKDLHALSSQTFQFLDLQERTESGQNLEQFPVMDGLLHGDCSTLNTGESPSVARESRLSWILEDNVPQKFYLSARACQGILTRASRRGKPLPELLKQALLDMIEWWNPGTLSQVVQKVKGTRRSGREGIGRVLESDHRETSTRCTEPAAYTLKIRSGCEGGGKGALVQTELSATISTLQDQTLICLVENPSLHNSKQKISPVVFESHSQDARYTQQGDTSPTCTAQWGTGGNNMPLVVEKKAFAMQRIGEYKESEHASTMKSRDYKDATDLIAEKETKNLRWIVRRLTPLEDERLQGFPDGWTDIGDWIDENEKKHKTSDAARYKALGNSIALPQWYWIFQKMKPYIGENPTLGSLFDGIGGFPLVFESTYGDGTTIWASEVDSFCIAVTKKRFPNVEDDK